MLYRAFDPAVIYKSFTHQKYKTFKEWQEVAETATQALVDWAAAHPVKKKGESLPVDEDVYRALKPYLKCYFQGKCAYCESDFDAVAWGDVEHYRPKRAVTGAVHPGYYWMAYAENNLMPSCQLCNQGIGKRNYFPIAGVRAMSKADDLGLELPLLLNPYEKLDCGEDCNHLRHVIEESGYDVLPTGYVEGLTPRGVESVKLYALNRQGLVKRRKKNQNNAIKALKAAVGTPALKAEWRALFDGEQEHATAVRAVAICWLQAYKRQLEESTSLTQASV
jgi:hypothetical protein